MDQLLLFTIPTTNLMVSILAICANTSSKSMPSLCRKPFDSNLALHLITPPLRFAFTLYTHLTPYGFFPIGRSTSSHVLFYSIDSASFSFLISILDHSRPPLFSPVRVQPWAQNKQDHHYCLLYYPWTTHNLANLQGMPLYLVDFLTFYSTWTSPTTFFFLSNIVGTIRHCCNQLQLDDNQSRLVPSPFLH